MPAASPAPHHATPQRTQGSTAARGTRLLGVDLARFVAIFGMFVIHFGAPFCGGPVEVALAQASSGRATALFTFLAGVSLAMLTGRRTPLAGSKLRDARVRVAVRAVLLLLIGLALAKSTEATGFLLTVIIPFYGVYFLLSLPFLGMSPRGTGIAAAVLIVAGPQLSYLVRWLLAGDNAFAAAAGAWHSVDPGNLIADLGAVDLLLTGFYPAATYLALVLAGLTLGRLDLRSRALRLRLGIGGAAVATATYVTTALLGLTYAPLSDVLTEGTVPLEHPQLLLAARAHSGSSFELIASLGIAVAVLALCLELADRYERPLLPLIKAGTMALTLYALHALVMSWQIVVGGWPLSGVPETLDELASMGPEAEWVPDLPAFPPDGHRPEGIVGFVNTYMSELFLLFSIGFATLWKRFFRRGPLEGAVSAAVDLCTRKLSYR
ncbi:heparan-alpha-glucosaminide N-acetyltransferase domain-containing protein [Saccharopolyspora sp. NPDC047091]|uniref:heparan-alpha-glucosaminide N-acetyltransferase domain-containing protein n=1 Tax=Saccharopolyspora sp. NPDC047091 TaxID=3155924 RepID=UPI0034105C6F